MTRDEEWTYLRLLRDRLDDFPAGEIDGDGESPDFVVGEGTTATGVEITRVAIADHERIGREREKIYVVNLAQRMCEPHLPQDIYVSVHMADSPKFTKSNRQAIAELLADQVRMAVPQPNGHIELNWQVLYGTRLYEFVQIINITRSSNLSGGPHWSSPSSSFVRRSVVDEV